MNTKKEILQHCVNILYEQLLMHQIDLKMLEKWYEGHEASDTAGYEYQEQKAKITRYIEAMTQKVEIAQQMLKEME